VPKKRNPKESGTQAVANILGDPEMSAMPLDLFNNVPQVPSLPSSVNAANSLPFRFFESINSPQRKTFFAVLHLKLLSFVRGNRFDIRLF
jgi:hypothetical protein